MTVFAGVDLGGTKVLAALVDEEGVVRRREEIPSDPKAGTASLLSALDRLLIGRGEEVAAIGVGVAAWVEFRSGTVVFAPNLDYDDPEIGRAVRDRFGLPVAVDNDANVAAWGEHVYGAGRGIDDMLMLTVGTGIGGGIVARGELYRGANGFAAEFGHMVILDAGPQCACGQQGCLEALASGGAIGRTAREEFSKLSSPALWDLSGGDVSNITGALVSEAARNGDEFSASVVRKAGYYFGLGLANLANLFDPELIVVGGSGAGSGEYLLGPAREELHRRLAGRRSPPRLQVAQLGTDAGVVGAAALARSLIET